MKKWGMLLISFTLMFTVVRCSDDNSVKDIGDAALALLLTDGSPVSLPTADDYNPTLLSLADNRLVLIFGSDRSTGTHNLWLAVSAGTFDGTGLLPPFNTPSMIKKTDGTALNLSKRINFVAAADNSQGKLHVVFTDNGQSDKIFSIEITTGSLTAPTATSEIDTKLSGPIIGGQVLTSGYKVFFMNQNQLEYFDPSTADGSTAPATTQVQNQAPLGEGVWISMMQEPLQDPDSFFITPWDQGGGGILLGYSQGFIQGDVAGLNIALGEAGLAMSYHSNLTVASGGTLFLFSAGGFDLSSQQDMYVVTSHDALELWFMTFENPFLEAFASVGFGTFPGDIPGLEAWYAADTQFGTHNSPLATWVDDSAMLRDLTGAPSTTEAVFNTFSTSGFPALVFNGTDQYYYNSNSITFGQIYAVAKYGANNDVAGASNAGIMSYGTTGDNTLFKVLASTSNLESASYINGAVSASTSFAPLDIFKIISNGAPTPVTGTDFVLGAGGNATTPSMFWTGEIGEVLIYDHQLSPEEDLAVLDYLKQKYRIPTFLPNQAVAGSPAVWLRADARVEVSSSKFNDCGGAPSCVVGNGWYDLLSATTVYTPSGSPTFPNYNLYALNGQPGVTFDGASMTKFSNGTSGTGATPTIFIVYQPEAFAGSPEVILSSRTTSTMDSGIEISIDTAGKLDVASGDGGTFFTSNPGIGNIHMDYMPRVLTVRGVTVPSNATEVYVDGALVTSIAQLGAAGTGLTLGASNNGSGTGYFNGSIAEVIIYNSTLSDADRQNVECYLLERYSIPPSPSAAPCPL